jgi:hypothetical protein
MADQAKVTSLDALENFRASLIVFLTKARRSIDEVRDAVRRTRQWLEHDQKIHWEAQIRVRRRALDQATQELFSARLSEFVDKTPRQQAMRKAKAALEEAEEKLRNTKKWNQNFDAAADPLTKRLESLRQFLDDDMPKGVNFLDQAQRTLDAYAETSLAEPTEPAPATAEPEAHP